MYKTIKLNNCRVVGICKTEKEKLIALTIKHLKLKLGTEPLMEHSLIFKFSQWTANIKQMNQPLFIREFGKSELLELIKIFEYVEFTSEIQQSWVIFKTWILVGKTFLLFFVSFWALFWKKKKKKEKVLY